MEVLVSNASIYQDISRKYSCIIHKTLNYFGTLRSAEFITDGTCPQKDIIYIFDFHIFEEISSEFICDTLISVGSPGESLIRRCKCVLEVPSTVEPFDLLNTVNRTFAYYRAWDQKLRNIFLHKGTVKDLLNASTEIFGTQIGIHDKNINCVVDSDYPEGDNCKYDTSIRRNNKNYIVSFLEDQEFLTSLQTHGAFFVDSASRSGRTLVQNIFLDGEFFYRVVITERNRPFKPQDVYLLEHLVEYLRPMLEISITGSSNDPAALRNFLSDVLNKPGFDLETYRKHLRMRNWMETDYYLCVVFVMAAADIFGNSAAAICVQIQQLIPNSVVFVYQERIVAIADMGPEPASVESVTGMFAEYMRDMNMKAGISNACQGYQSIRDLYLQADIALNMGGRLWSHLWLSRFHNVAPYYILEQCSRELRAATLCAPEILRLIRHDMEHGTEYFKTIKVYLGCNLNLAETSRQLFIHRTTLLYRLGKIQELSPMSFNSPLERIYYHLSVLLISYNSFSGGDCPNPLKNDSRHSDAEL